MTFAPALDRMTPAAFRGGKAVGQNNNNRNNASHPRAGD